ncbi:MAG: hypothetical protein EXR09_11910 [Acetobacteraceae bacterium]|nr:hypothetical protein [Acetobacteraceae bacterium]
MPAIARRRAVGLAGSAVVAQLSAWVSPAAGQTSPGDPPSLLPGAAVPSAPPKPAPQAPRGWPSYFDRKSVWGYFNRHSLAQGETCELMLSTAPDKPTTHGRVEFHRLGGSTPGVLSPVWTSPVVSVFTQRNNVMAAAVGPNWQPTLEKIDTSNWPPGYYSADFVGGTSRPREGQPGLYRDPHVAQIIVCPARPRGGVLMKLGTNTYQAYNDWGGFSFYTGGRAEMARGPMVSFDRPSPPGFLEYEIFLVRWLENLAQRDGFQVDYASNFDVHIDPALLPAYRLVICGSHDEYWSKEEFDAFEQRIFRQGSNTIFMGGNIAYWQVRYADINRSPGGPDYGRQLICHKTVHDPIVRRPGTTDPSLLMTAQFREGNRRPETMLMGVGYESWFSPGGGTDLRVPYHVATAAHPFFEGTGYQSGDQSADVVGYEWDNRDPAGNGERLWAKRSSRNAQIPLDKIQVLFHANPVDIDGRRGTAEAVYFESPAGAKVFSAGTIRWAWGLSRPGFTQPGFLKFNENMIRQMLS